MTPIITRWLALDATERLKVLRATPEAELHAYDAAWTEWAHAGQREPAGAWRTWVMMAGRGFGKTRAGSAWVHGLARARGSIRIALVAATVEEARRVMVEGPSGLLATAAHPSEQPVFDPSLRRVRFPGGAEATLFSGAHPESLRGPEHHLPGATNSPNGGTRRRPGTCCNWACAAMTTRGRW